MERKAELIAREKIKTDLDLPNCGHDQTCNHYRSQLEKDYKERVHCPVTHPISYSDGKHCCPIQNWFDKSHRYDPAIIKCLEEDSTDGCCNDVSIKNCTSKFCYDNPIRYLDSYILKDSKDSNPLCNLLSEQCHEKSIKSTCPKTCQAKDLSASKLNDTNILCNHVEKSSCIHQHIRDSCPITCGQENIQTVEKNSVIECEDKRDWCNNYPNCETDIARQICPKSCKLCTVAGKPFFLYILSDPEKSSQDISCL